MLRRNLTDEVRANCGIGGIAYMDANSADHSIINLLGEELCCADTRGGVSPCKEGGPDYDGNGTGDGAGVLTDIPHDFLKETYYNRLRVYKKGNRLPHNSNQFPDKGTYAVGHFHLQLDKQNPNKLPQESFQKIIDTLDAHDLQVVAQREIPTNYSTLSKDAIDSRPYMLECIIVPKMTSNNPQGNFIDSTTGQKTFNSQAFKKKLKEADLALEVTGNKSNQKFTVTSLSDESVIYKGLLRASQVIPFFTDLQHKKYTSQRAMYHVRFSTNSGSTWDGAHPKKNFSHNGEFNTILANVRRHEELHSQVYKVKERVINPNGSDTEELDRANTALQIEKNVSLPTAILMQMPPVIQPSDDPEKEKQRKFFKYLEHTYKPAGGPAHIAFTSDEYFGAFRDPGGFRPSNMTIYTDKNGKKIFRMGSESIVTDKHIQPDSKIERYVPPRGGLRALQKQADGSFTFIDTQTAIKHAIKECNFNVETYDASHIPLLNDNATPTPLENGELTLAQRRMMGYQDDVDDRALDYMAKTGKVQIVGMGDDRNIAALSNRPRRISDFFKQRFVMVTAPALDPIREAIATSIEITLGANPLKVPGAKFITLNSPILPYGTADQITNMQEIQTATLDATMGIAEGDLAKALNTLCDQAEKEVQNGAEIIIISDKKISSDKAPIPDMLAIAAVNKRLKDKGLSLKASIIAESCSVTDAHHVAMLLASGASAVNPYMAYDAVIRKKEAASHAYEQDAKTLCDNIHAGLGYGLKFIMSRMGFNRVSSYVDAMGAVIESTGIKTNDHGKISDNEFELTNLFPTVSQNLGIYDLRHFELMARWQHKRALDHKDTEFVLPNDKKKDTTGFSQEWVQAFRKMLGENHIDAVEQENKRKGHLAAATTAKHNNLEFINETIKDSLKQTINIPDILAQETIKSQYKGIARELLTELSHFHTPDTTANVKTAFSQFLQDNEETIKKLLETEIALNALEITQDNFPEDQIKQHLKTIDTKRSELFKQLKSVFPFNTKPPTYNFNKNNFEQKLNEEQNSLSKEKSILESSMPNKNEKGYSLNPSDQDKSELGYNLYKQSITQKATEDLENTARYTKRHRPEYDFEGHLEHLDTAELGALTQPERRLYHSLRVKGREAAFARAFFGRQILHTMQRDGNETYKKIIVATLEQNAAYKKWLIKHNLREEEEDSTLAANIEAKNPFLALQSQESDAFKYMSNYLQQKKDGTLPRVDIGIMDGKNNRLLKIDGRYSAQQMNGYTLSKGFSPYNETTEKAEQTLKPLPHHLLHLKTDKEYTLPISAVEPMENMLKHFTSGAMSYGSVKWLAHGDIAEAHNAIGTDGSNDGEGGHPTNDLNRSGRNKQWASGRFGTGHAMIEIVQCMDGMMQIKIAQGAKPGEGGELPGEKVDAEIASTRKSIPGIGLISPPPHHDIYSIEDLKSLIMQFKKAGAQVSVKLCATAAIKPIIAGVIKCGADSVSMPCGSGGTGAAKHFSQTGAGIAGILGLLYAIRSIEDNNLKTKLFTSGSFKTIKDLVLALALADIETGTIQLGASGCVAIDECFKAAQVKPGNVETGGCSVGVTNTAWNYEGKVEDIERLSLDFAAAIRQELARMGYTNIEELRNDFLQGNVKIIADKLGTLSSALGKLELGYDEQEIQELLTFNYNTKREKPELTFDELDPAHDADGELATKIIQDIDNPAITEYIQPVSTKNVAFGASFARLQANYNNKSLYSLLQEKKKPIKIITTGSAKENGRANNAEEYYMSAAGQRYGAMLGDNIHLHHIGFFHDYVGGSQMGGTISITPPLSQRQEAEKNVIAGNSCLYGATGGKAYFNGTVGDRFGIRKSGGVSIVTGDAGDFALEYNSNGEAYFLGKVGDGFGAGMTGGFGVVYNNDAIPYDTRNVSVLNNKALEPYLNVIKQHIEECRKFTGSVKCADILREWEQNKSKFSLIIPNGMLAIEQGLQQENGAELAKYKEKADMILEAYGEPESLATLSPMMQIWVERIREFLQEAHRRGDQPGNDQSEGGSNDKPTNDNNKDFSWKDVDNAFTKQHNYNSTKAHIQAVYDNTDTDTKLTIDEKTQNLSIVIADILSRTSCSCGAATCGSCSLERDTQMGAKWGGEALKLLQHRLQPITITPAINAWIDTVIPEEKKGDKTERRRYALGYEMAKHIYDQQGLTLYETDYLKASYKRYAGASPFMFTSRVCPAACESSCTKVNGPGAVPVKGIEYVIHEVAETRGFWKDYIHQPTHAYPSEAKQYHIAIVGSGPAGLEAALRARLKGYKVTVFEKKNIDFGNNAAGGLTRDGIPANKNVASLAQHYYERLKDIGIEFTFGKAPTKEDLSTFNGVILATGVADNPRILPGNITLDSINHAGVFEKHEALKTDKRTEKNSQETIHQITLPLAEAIKKGYVSGFIQAMDLLSAHNAEYRAQLLNQKDFTNPFIEQLEGKNIIQIGAGDTGTDVLHSLHLQQKAGHSPKSITILKRDLHLDPKETTVGKIFPEPREVQDPNWEAKKRKLGSIAKEKAQTKISEYHFNTNGELTGVTTESLDFDKGTKDLPKGRRSSTASPTKHKRSDNNIIKTDYIIQAMGFLGPLPEYYNSLGIQLNRNNVAQVKNHTTAQPFVSVAGDCDPQSLEAKKTRAGHEERPHTWTVMGAQNSAIHAVDKLHQLIQAYKDKSQEAPKAFSEAKAQWNELRKKEYHQHIEYDATPANNNDTNQPGVLPW